MNHSPLSLETARAAIQARITLMEAELATIREIVRVLLPFDGKEVTKRAATALQKVLPDMRVYYEASDTRLFGWRKVCVWGGPIPYDSRMSLTLAKESEGFVFSHAAFVQGPSPDGTPYGERVYVGPAWCYLKRAEDIESARALLADLPARVERYNAAQAALKDAATAFAPLGYAVFNWR